VALFVLVTFALQQGETTLLSQRGEESSMVTKCSHRVY